MKNSIITKIIFIVRNKILHIIMLLLQVNEF